MVFCTPSEVDSALNAQGATLHEIPESMFVGQDIPYLRFPPYASYTNDRLVFARLGLSEISSMDISAYQQADIIYDLNKPVPNELRERFNLIIDGGTIEHIFDVRQVFENIVHMLKVGGSVIHMSPMSGYVDHGFFQISPTLLLSYYEQNGFGDLSCLVSEHPSNKPNRSQWKFWYWNPAIARKRFLSKTTLALYFRAVKKERTSHFRTPIQSFDSETRDVIEKVHETEPWGLELVRDLLPLHLDPATP